MPNPVNSTWNKAAYTTLWTALTTVFFLFAPDLGLHITAEKVAAITGLGGILINVFVPNKDPSA